VIVCRICKIEKSTEEYSPRQDRPCGFESRCKPCNAKRALDTYKANREVYKERMRIRANARYKKDSSLAKFHATMRKAHVKRATPKWADKKALRLFYKACPNGYHVDHIIPLRGKYISGLHINSNLQYLSAKENMAKHNKYSSEYNLSTSARLPKQG